MELSVKHVIYSKNFTKLNRMQGRLNVKNCKYFYFITLRVIDVNMNFGHYANDLATFQFSMNLIREHH